MADLDVGPIAHVEGAIRTHALRNRDEGGVVAAQEVVAMVAGETAARGDDLVGDEAVAMEVAEDEQAVVGCREIIAVIDRQARVRVAAAHGVGRLGNLQRVRFMDPAARVMSVVGDRLDVVVGVGIEMLTSLTLVAGAGQDMVEVRDDAGRVEEFPTGVEVQTPGIARAFGENLEDVAGGMEAPDAGVDLLALRLGRARLAHDRVGEHAVVAVEPAVGTPDEAVERLMRILEAPAVEQHDRLAGLVVSILRDEEEFRSRADPHAAVADFDARDEVETFLEDRDLGVRAVLLHILQDQDAVGPLPFRTLLRIAHAFHDPEAPAFVEAHRDRLNDLGLGRDERDLEAGRERHRAHRVGGRLAGLIGPWGDADSRTRRQRRGGEAGGCEKECEESHGGARRRLRRQRS